ncbi:MAG: hypothetical protein A3G30_04575 [Chlamydiae bacterium RIFCSPLOWO2_12_FULL_49_12]|nr:MAG: hypothetical protein A2Z85_03050 [Chlamydiae bacterium GWA2_50_15]OGN70290.1 MAG: hypothetical protein A3I15_02690 [Chlamydiae bacterium RIFCSPLOWO2_02_FULL_49_12]OGN71504.1 MAG: hypothetical protein A3G30_04575 [Chlamydiae bacterium RIFCSPLOWO2_12_FULL_49_12]
MPGENGLEEERKKKGSLQEIASFFESDQKSSKLISSYCIDSRQAVKGSCFFALKGKRVDGHDFLQEVAERKGVAALVDKEYRGKSFGLLLLRVPDVLTSLQQLAKSVQKERKGSIIGITGSVGKTTTKEFLSTLLEESFLLYKSPLSYNSQTTLPLNLLNAKGDEELFLLEMGMSQKGEIRRHVEIAPPHYAIITRIGRTHTEFFPDGIEGVAYAKGEILESPALKAAVIFEDALAFSSIKKRGACQKISFGSPSSDYFLKRVRKKVYVVERGKPGPLFLLPFAADHLLSNFLACVALCRTLGLGWEEIVRRAQRLRLPSKRFEIVIKEGITFVNDSYNASAESTLAALGNLPSPEKGKRTLFVFGEMRELGALSEESHREVGRAAAEATDHLICLGDGCRPVMEAFCKKGKKGMLFHDLQTLKEALFLEAAQGDVVLIKGANSHQLWRLLE